MPDRLPEPLKSIVDLIRVTIEDGVANDLQLFASAVAYSLLLSLAPLTIALSYLGSRISEFDTGVLLISPLEDSVGLEQIIGAPLRWAGPLASAVSVGVVLFGAATLFRQVTGALSRIWHQPDVGRSGIPALLRRHAFSMLLLLIAGAATLLSASIGHGLAGLGDAVVDFGAALGIRLGWLGAITESRAVFDFVFSSIVFAVATMLVPVVRPRWVDILPGTLVTAAAYTVGQAVLAWYLSSSVRFSSLGQYGGLLAFLVWVFYTATIMLWGAQLTFEIAKRRGCARGGVYAAPYTRGGGAGRGCVEVDSAPPGYATSE